ncbi:hypothetical protein LCGC14_1826380 [marine sediment metagenome]|uniref:Uncharacterized protein n=1 Tax=marine sediment metagenome TaxID=412755 RepID=A0A0F9JGV8_9ZZZZ
MNLDEIEKAIGPKPVLGFGAPTLGWPFRYYHFDEMVECIDWLNKAVEHESARAERAYNRGVQDAQEAAKESLPKNLIKHGLDTSIKYIKNRIDKACKNLIK